MQEVNFMLFLILILGHYPLLRGKIHLLGVKLNTNFKAVKTIFEPDK